MLANNFHMCALTRRGTHGVRPELATESGDLSYLGVGKGWDVDAPALKGLAYGLTSPRRKTNLRMEHTKEERLKGSTLDWTETP